MHEGSGEPGSVRIDRWLWAARFFKTRSLAHAAIDGGHVRADGERVKASRSVRVGDVLEVAIGEERLTVVVRGLAERRGPASVARELYEETAASQERRARLRESRRVAPPVGADLGERPTKRDRRRLDALRRGDEPRRRP